MTIDPVSNLESMVSAALANESGPTQERVRELIDGLRNSPLFDSVTDVEAEQLARRLEERVSVTQGLGTVLKEEDHRPWLAATKAQIDSYYWNRYRKHLIQEGFPINGIAALDEATDRVLDLMQDPSKGDRWDRRGMVMGHVQSGKTANYTGLICKAADAGYKLVVVIAGIHNSLRNQTQYRIDRGFIGRDSARLLTRQPDLFVGVGRFDNGRRPISFTNTLRDFNKVAATNVGIPLQTVKEPAVFVIKKNTSTLKNLIEWLQEHSARGGNSSIDLPMLVIDDEADNASINIRHDKGEVSRINGQIRQLLQIFDRSCYIGYTATPFANIFIDPDTDDQMLGDDLFPKSFIVSLDPPSDYFGGDAVFANDGVQHIRHIEDNRDILPSRHNKDFEVISLPPSLLEAVRCYIIGRGIRLAGGQLRKHSSMLVNASPYIRVQSQIRNEIHAVVASIQRSVKINGALSIDEALSDPEIGALHDTWVREFADIESDWPAIQSQLVEAVSPIKVIEVNSRSPASLDYTANEEHGLNVIAVGGYSLSRGLTLEGLMVSYFLRNSMMYDTLMQMSRWFGYRPGYKDLCRIWMSDEAHGWYEHIAESTEELRSEIRTMEALGATPEQFGLRIRSHPDTLVVTARNKMGAGEQVRVRISLADTLMETHMLPASEAALRENHQAVVRLSQSLDSAGFPINSANRVEFGWLVRQVPAELVLNFIGQFQQHPDDLKTSSEPVRRYIEERQTDELSEWDVLFASVYDENNTLDASLGTDIRRQRRSAGETSDAKTLRIGGRQRVSGRGIERTGLTAEQREAAEIEYRGERARDGKLPEDGRVQYPDWTYRKKRTNPLLMIHLIDIDEPQPPSPQIYRPVVAWGISFPKTARDEKRVEYVVNPIWLRDRFWDAGDDEELQGDDA